MDKSEDRRRRFLVVAMCIIGVVTNVLIVCNFYLPGAWWGLNDFLSFWSGARLVGGPHLYDRAAVQQEYIEAIGATGEIEFGRLPCFAFFLKPLTWLSYYHAAAVFESLSALALLGFLALWPGGSPKTRWLIGCWSLPAFVAIFQGQDDLFLLFWAALSARWLRAGKAFAAGAILALCSSKFHLFLLVPLVMIAQRRWGMLGGLAFGMAVLLAISFAVAGPTWPWALYTVLAGTGMSMGIDHMPNLHSLFAGAGQLLLPLHIVVVLIAVVGILVSARRANAWESCFGVALTAGLFVGFHAYLHDGSLLLPYLIAFSGCAIAYARFPAIVLATMLPWVALQEPVPIPAIAQLLILAAACTGLVILARGLGNTLAAPSAV